MRVSTFSSFARVLLGIQRNQSDAVRAQEQLASGKRILRPSDDPVGASRALQLDHHLADVARFREAIATGRTSLDAGAGALEEASSLMTETRELLVQALNGTLNDSDRASIAVEIEALRNQLFDVANTQLNGRYLFAGAATGDAPWSEIAFGDGTRYAYQGSPEELSLRIGEGIDVPVTLTGVDIFGQDDPGGAVFDGLTGVQPGTTANQGTGSLELEVRHDATDIGALAGLGIAAVSGGANDTLLGVNALVIDTVEGTIRLGNGPVGFLPDFDSEEAGDVVVRNELGGELHLDLSSYDGTSFDGTVTASGSVSLDGVNFVSIDFTETDLELFDAETNTVLHVNTSGIGRAGSELVDFSGTGNVFDLLSGIAGDLRNADGLSQTELNGRLTQRLAEFDRGHERILSSLGTLGSRSQGLSVADERTADVEFRLQAQLSGVVDADFAEVALDLARSEQILQTAQASGARLLQNTLLNFLR